ncbi:MAG: hypothetical protein JNM27_01765 [Leptospirales bacterium]|nr:hypothetical protein [Leptospirales bacterium]
MHKLIQLTLIAVAVFTTGLYAETVGYKLTWEKNPTAKSYDVEVSPTQDFSKVVQNLKADTNEARFSMEPSEPKYYWRYRAVDTAGKAGAWSQVAELQKPAATADTKSDTIPPLQISSDSMKQNGMAGADMYSLPAGKSLVVRFNPKDDISGVGEVYAKVNGGLYSLVPNAEMRLTADGAYVIEWYAIDRAGNKSPIQIRRIYLDSTAPSLVRTIDSSKVATDGSLAKTAKIVLAARDEGTGLDKIEWRSGTEGDWKVYESAIAAASIAQNDMGVIQYRAKDKIGNETAIQTYSYRIDSIPPQLPTIFQGLQEPYRIPREGLSVADFPKNALVEYKIDESDFKKLEPGDRIVIDKEGEHTVTIRVTDEVGNVTEKTFKVLVDNTPPKSELMTEIAP